MNTEKDAKEISDLIGDFTREKHHHQKELLISLKVITLYPKKVIN